MACGCRKKDNSDSGRPARETTVVVPPAGILPTEQCIACAQKHFDEAWTAWVEFGYRAVNRRFVRGNLRSVVLHTYKAWPETAKLARECALLVQEYRDDEATGKMETLGDMIDGCFLDENPEIKRRKELLDGRSAGAGASGQRVEERGQGTEVPASEH